MCRPSRSSYPTLQTSDNVFRVTRVRWVCVDSNLDRFFFWRGVGAVQGPLKIFFFADLVSLFVLLILYVGSVREAHLLQICGLLLACHMFKPDLGFHYAVVLLCAAFSSGGVCIVLEDSTLTMQQGETVKQRPSIPARRL